MRIYPKDKSPINYHLDRKWIVEYNHLVYDGGDIELFEVK